MNKLLAVPFGRDGVKGDSSFYPSEGTVVPATEKSTFVQLLKAWKKQEQVMFMQGDPLPVGFWLLTPQNLKIALTPSNSIEAYNDGDTYLLNNVTKTLCKSLATRTVKR